MFRMNVFSALAVLTTLLIAGCAGGPTLPPAEMGTEGPAPMYRIGPGDNLQIFVWRNAELSTSVPVRPDGRISVPLIEDLEVTGKTATELAREIEKQLGVYVQDPNVTIIITSFGGPFNQQIRVVGAAAKPQAIEYRANMTALDAMIAVGGLTQFAAGNRAALYRKSAEGQKQYRVRLDDLLKNGDISANVELLPGDILIIPESIF
ncbi:MAG: XrtA/PEP-CTERM system exopolysaccharide export protein [Alphaproteobacteria bacterium]